MAYDESTHWRDSSRTPRFFFMDAKAAFPLVLFLLHMRLVTFLIALGFIVFFSILERFQFTVPIFLRWIKSTLSGPDRISRPWWRD
ncbi:MAG: hypothetical protein RLZ35_1071 [Pseudomonadota bacterium]